MLDNPVTSEYTPYENNPLVAGLIRLREGDGTPWLAALLCGDGHSDSLHCIPAVPVHANNSVLF